MSASAVALAPEGTDELGRERQSLDALGSWVLFVVGADGFAAVLLDRQFARRHLSRVAQPPGLVLIKIGAVVVLAAIATYLLTGTGRSPPCPSPAFPTSDRSCSCRSSPERSC
jgi:hypothetical protein